MSSRKIRSDSTTAKVLANDAAQRKLEPPQKLTQAEILIAGLRLIKSELLSWLNCT